MIPRFAWLLLREVADLRGVESLVRLILAAATHAGTN